MSQVHHTSHQVLYYPPGHGPPPPRAGGGSHPSAPPPPQPFGGYPPPLPPRPPAPPSYQGYFSDYPPPQHAYHHHHHHREDDGCASLLRCFDQIYCTATIVVSGEKGLDPKKEKWQPACFAKLGLSFMCTSVRIIDCHVWVLSVAAVWRRGVGAAAFRPEK